MMQVRIADDALALACGADAVADSFARAGYDVIRTSSWGLHWLEPLVEIHTAEGWVGYGPVTPADVPTIIDGTSLLALGVVADHPFITRQTRLTFQRAGHTRPLSLEDYAATHGWEGLTRARAIGPQAIIEDITHSGLRGRGGAGFPVGIKWRSVADAVGARKYIVCNADEGDSGTFADRMLMEGDPFALIEGMAIAAHATGADKGYIYLRSEYPHAQRKLATAIELARDIIAPFEIELRMGAGAYICGEETSLLNSLEGKRGEVRAKPPLPSTAGLFGCPTVVNNVLSLAAAAHILREGGADEYASLGMGRSRGTMPVQLAGNIRHGGLFEAPFGITVQELINEIGGGTQSGRPIKAVQAGGPLGAYIPPSQFDLPFDYEAFADADALIGHGGLVVFDDTADMAAMARFAFDFCAFESCGKCTPCRMGAVRGAEVVDQILAGGRPVDGVERLPQMHNAPKQGRSVAESRALLDDLCDVMQSASLCALGGFTPYPVRSALRHWPEDFDL